MNDPILNNFLNGSVRPINERTRRAIQQVSDLLLAFDADVASIINGEADGEPIEDGRAELPIRTVGELRHWIRLARMLAALSKYVDANQNTPTQAALNEIFNTVNVPLIQTKFTVRSGLFE